MLLLDAWRTLAVSPRLMLKMLVIEKKITNKTQKGKIMRFLFDFAS